jgi:hypothetical protein
VGVDAGIAVNFTGRGLQDLDLEPLCQAQHVYRADDTRLGGLHRILLVVDRRSRAGEIENLIDLYEERVRDVVAEQLEGLVTEQVLDIAPRARKEVVDAKDLAAGVEQPLAQMGPEESRAP